MGPRVSVDCLLLDGRASGRPPGGGRESPRAAWTSAGGHVRSPRHRSFVCLLLFVTATYGTPPTSSVRSSRQAKRREATNQRSLKKGCAATCRRRVAQSRRGRRAAPVFAARRRAARGGREGCRPGEADLVSRDMSAATCAGRGRAVVRGGPRPPDFASLGRGSAGCGCRPVRSGPDRIGSPTRATMRDTAALGGADFVSIFVFP